MSLPVRILRELNRSDILVYACVAECAGACRNQVLIRSETGLSERAVRESVRRLEERGLLTREGQSLHAVRIHTNRHSTAGFETETGTPLPVLDENRHSTAGFESGHENRHSTAGFEEKTGTPLPVLDESATPENEGETYYKNFFEEEDGARPARAHVREADSGSSSPPPIEHVPSKALERLIKAAPKWVKAGLLSESEHVDAGTDTACVRIWTRRRSRPVRSLLRTAQLDWLQDEQWWEADANDDLVRLHEVIQRSLSESDAREQPAESPSHACGQRAPAAPVSQPKLKAGPLMERVYESLVEQWGSYEFVMSHWAGMDAELSGDVLRLRTHDEFLVLSLGSPGRNTAALAQRSSFERAANRAAGRSVALEFVLATDVAQGAA